MSFFLKLRLKDTREEVVSLFADDFNTTQVLLAISDLIDELNSSLQSSVTATKGTSTTVIQAYNDYIDKTLVMLGVNIICKKVYSHFTNYSSV